MVWATPAAIAGRGVARPVPQPLLRPGPGSPPAKAQSGVGESLGNGRRRRRKTIVVPIWSDGLPTSSQPTTRRPSRFSGAGGVGGFARSRPFLWPHRRRSLSVAQVVPRTAVRERPLHWVASPEGAGGAAGSGRGREPAAGSLSRFLPAAAGSRTRCTGTCARTAPPPVGICRRPSGRVPPAVRSGLAPAGTRADPLRPEPLAQGARVGTRNAAGVGRRVRGGPRRSADHPIVIPVLFSPAEALPIPYGRSDANKTMGWSATVRGPPHCYPRLFLPAEALPITVRGPPHCSPRFVLPAEALPIPYGRSGANKTMGWSAMVRGPPHCYPRFVLPAEPCPYRTDALMRTKQWGGPRTVADHPRGFPARRVGRGRGKARPGSSRARRLGSGVCGLRAPSAGSW